MRAILGRAIGRLKTLLISAGFLGNVTPSRFFVGFFFCRRPGNGLPPIAPI